MRAINRLFDGILRYISRTGVHKQDTLILRREVLKIFISSCFWSVLGVGEASILYFKIKYLNNIIFVLLTQACSKAVFSIPLAPAWTILEGSEKDLR